MHQQLDLKNTLFCNILVIFLTLMVSSCQSNLEIAGDKHQTSTEKWHALAKYSSTTLAPFNLIITAKFDHSNISSKMAVRFTEVKLSNRTTPFNINLIEPSFSNKYICTPLCSQLTEYLQENNNRISDDTLLSLYFKKHEFELFQFYSDMFILGDQLERLAKENPDNLYNYLQWISKSELSANSLIAFTLLLNEKLTVEKYQDFINNPPIIYPSVETNIVASPENNWLENNSIPPEVALLSQSSSSIDESGTQQENPSPDDDWVAQSEIASPESTFPNELWEISPLVSENKHWAPMNNSPSKNWFEPADNKLEIKDTVCSYNENYFGIVQSISQEEIHVWVLGQAKIKQDDIVSNPESGELFKEKIKSIFIPINKLKTFSLSDISLCELS